MPKRTEPDRTRLAYQHLPVRPAAFAVLAALRDGPAAGFTVLERANQALPGRPILGPGTLYRLLLEMREDGLIERTAAPREEPGGGDERRTYHRLTPLGRSVLLAEAERLRRIMGAAGLLPGEGM